MVAAFAGWGSAHGGVGPEGLRLGERPAVDGLQDVGVDEVVGGDVLGLDALLPPAAGLLLGEEATLDLSRKLAELGEEDLAVVADTISAVLDLGRLPTREECTKAPDVGPVVGSPAHFLHWVAVMPTLPVSVDVQGTAANRGHGYLLWYRFRMSVWEEEKSRK